MRPSAQTYFGHASMNCRSFTRSPYSRTMSTLGPSSRHVLCGDIHRSGLQDKGMPPAPTTACPDEPYLPKYAFPYRTLCPCDGPCLARLKQLRQSPGGYESSVLVSSEVVIDLR